MANCRWLVVTVWCVAIHCECAMGLFQLRTSSSTCAAQEAWSGHNGAWKGSRSTSRLGRGTVARTMAPLSTDNLNRGDRYSSDSSTILSATDVAANVGVQPPAEVPAKVWKRAWWILKYATPLLHLFDRDVPPNSSLNLYCLWWKALSGNDKNSPVFDDSLSFDILPRGTRWIVAKPSLFPRLHHANVEIRTSFLDRSVTKFAQENPKSRIQLVSFGAGYDVRSIKLTERKVVDRAFELDLSKVVQAKQRILDSKRFRRRRPHIDSHILPTFCPVDLNDLDSVKKTLN